VVRARLRRNSRARPPFAMTRSPKPACSRTSRRSAMNSWRMRNREGPLLSSRADVRLECLLECLGRSVGAAHDAACSSPRATARTASRRAKSPRFAGSLQAQERMPLIWFLVIFPILVLAVFTWLVISHSTRLFAPSDFKNEDNFVKLNSELRAAVEEANVTAEQLQRLLRPILAFSLGQLTYSNRIGRLPDREHYREALVGAAAAVGLDSEPAFQTALGEFYRLETWDRYQRLVSHVRLTDQQIELSDALNALSTRDTINFPDHSAIERLSGELLSVEAKRLAQEYLLYRNGSGSKAIAT
jgi:hypothetical protein